MIDETRVGRPRSDGARIAVLHAVDDLLVEVGYAAVTMKGIAERAGVGRQTVYRWWSTKAEILLEACAHDFAQKVRSPHLPDPSDDLAAYLRVLNRFLTDDDAGHAYRALVGEGQHDAEVRRLVTDSDLLETSALPVLDRNRPILQRMPSTHLAVAQLVGPVLMCQLIAASPLSTRQLRDHADRLADAWN